MNARYQRQPSKTNGGLRALPQSMFNEISSELSLGQPMTDISRGWDGTLWALDAVGAPHLYDPIDKIWNPYGGGIDAAAMVGTRIYHFRGAQVVACEFGTNLAGAPQAIGEVWPGLAYSFQLGVTGAASINGSLCLFARGQYVSVDAPDQVLFLDQLKGWPSLRGWQGGAIDGCYSIGANLVMLFRQGEWIIVDIPAKCVVSAAPMPLFQYSPFANVPAEFLGPAFDGGFANGPNMTLYQGPSLLAAPQQSGDVSVRYVGAVYSGWPATWNPVLAHAPAGRIGNLWSAMGDGKGVMHHDGNEWNAIAGGATYAAVGVDGSVFTIGDGSQLWQRQSSGDWQPVAAAPSGSTLSQISVGDANRIWARDQSNAVFSLTEGAFLPIPQVGQAVHLAANYDGSVWHCNDDPSTYRYGGAGANSDPFSIPQGTALKVASTGFGTSHCLTNANGVALYEYASPFAYKSAPDYNLGLNATGRIAAGDGSIFFLHWDGDIDQQSPNFQSYIVATDSQTGQQLWKTPLPWPNCWGGAPTYDPRLNRVYFGMAVAEWSDGTSPGSMIALNAKTGELVWYIQERASSNPGLILSVDFAPAVFGSLLIFGDRGGYLHAIDTDAAVSGGSTEWSILGALGQNPGNLRVSTPAIANGLCYFYTWSSGDSAFYVQSCVAADGSALNVPPWRKLSTTPGVTPAFWPPILGRATFPTDKPARYLSRQATSCMQSISASARMTAELPPILTCISTRRISS